MNTNSIFTVENDDLSRLDQNTSVDFFRKLLWAEARRLGIELSKINVSSWVNVPDGGVDASVDGIQINNGMGIIKQGKTCYQIKSGTEFKPWQEAVIKEELFGSKTPECENLKESIQNCFDVDGTYVLVCTGIDPVPKDQDSIRSHIVEYLEQCGYSNPKIEVFTQNNLKGFLESFPSLALQVKKLDKTNYQSHESWAEDDDMRSPFFPGKSQTVLISKIQDELRNNNTTSHVRIVGVPGIGKTKLVFEATREDDLSPLVIYCNASQFRDSELMNAILRVDNSFYVILIVDECDPDNRFYIWNKLQHRGPRIKLITIYNDSDPIAGSSISEFSTERLEDDQILAIIKGHGVTDEQAKQYIQFSDGSPRMAHHTGRILSNHPGDPSQLLNDDYLYQRFYIDLIENTNSQSFQQRELVLRYISLFKRFGFSGPVVTEAQEIAKKVEVANPNITWSRFQEIIDDLRKRKILQGGSTLYITPIALQIKLWVDWWKIYGNTFDLEMFIQDLPTQLVEWFFEMYRYAGESEAAAKVVKSFLSPNGVFKDIEDFNTRLGSRFFLALTEADPKSALGCLRRTIGNCDRESLQLFSEGRRDVIWALEKIVMHRSLFPDGVRLLLKLGEAENEHYSNNASGVFARLFSLGYGQVAPTEAYPEERFPILTEAFESESKEQRILALKACDAGLETDNFSRISGAERQGLPKEFDYWKPKTDRELYEAYRQVWKILSDQLDLLPEDEREEALEILLKNTPRIARIPYLRDMVIGYNSFTNEIKNILINCYS